MVINELLVEITSSLPPVLTNIILEYTRHYFEGIPIKTVWDFSRIFGLTVDDDTLYSTEWDSGYVRAWDCKTTTMKQTIATLQGPSGIAVYGGEIYVAEGRQRNHHIHIYDVKTGEKKRKFSGLDLDMIDPQGFTVFGDEIYIADDRNARVAVFDRFSGKMTRVLGQLAGGFRFLCLSHGENDSIAIYDPKSGKLLRRFKESLINPKGISIYGDAIFVVSSESWITIFNMQGDFLRKLPLPHSHIGSCALAMSENQLFVAEWGSRLHILQ